MSVFVLTSDTYRTKSAIDPEHPQSILRVVGVFDSYAAAENYQRFATPPVEDGQITEWEVSTRAEQQRNRHANCISDIVQATRTGGDLPDVKAALVKYGWIDASE